MSVPIVSIGIKHTEIWYPVEAFVDSGATYSIFTAEVARTIGLEYEGGRKIFVQVGDGGLIPAYLHDLTIQLGSEKFVAPLGFSGRLGVGFNLLGRNGIFDRFKVCFDEKNSVVTFQNHEMAL